MVHFVHLFVCCCIASQSGAVALAPLCIASNLPHIRTAPNGPARHPISSHCICIVTPRLPNTIHTGIHCPLLSTPSTVPVRVLFLLQPHIHAYTTQSIYPHPSIHPHPSPSIPIPQWPTKASSKPPNPASCPAHSWASRSPPRAPSSLPASTPKPNCSRSRTRPSARPRRCPPSPRQPRSTPRWARCTWAWARRRPRCVAGTICGMVCVAPWSVVPWWALGRRVCILRGGRWPRLLWRRPPWICWGGILDRRIMTLFWRGDELCIRNKKITKSKTHLVVYYYPIHYSLFTSYSHILASAIKH